MPVAYRTSAVFGDTAGTTDRSGSIAALKGDLLVVFASISDMATVSVTDDAGGTYTQASYGVWGAGSDVGVAFVRNTLVAANATITVTVDTDTNTAAQAAIVAVSGMYRAGSNAIRSHGANAGKAAASLTVTLTRLPLVATNLLLGCLASLDTTVTPPTDFTERHDVSQATPTTALEVVTRDPNASDPSSLGTTGQAQWTALSGDTVALLLELDARPIGPLVLIGRQKLDTQFKAGDYTSGLQAYVPTPGTQLVRGRLIGSGGSGGSASTTNGAAGTGGGAGEYVEFEVDALGGLITGGPVVVGAPVGSAATAGNPTSITIQGVTITGQGGGAGVSTAAIGVGHPAAAPVLGASGSVLYDILRSAERGQPNFWAATSVVIGGNGGNGPLGRGGAGANGSNADGGAGTGYGAGGGGACRSTTNQVGGASAPGVILLEEYAYLAPHFGSSGGR